NGYYFDFSWLASTTFKGLACPARRTHRIAGVGLRMFAFSALLLLKSASQEPRLQVVLPVRSEATLKLATESYPSQPSTPSVPKCLKRRPPFARRLRLAVPGGPHPRSPHPATALRFPAGGGSKSILAGKRGCPATTG